ncbi:LysR family transcriptional regulator [Luteimonas kalidii]|uniref:LysR family transcriptional regulator n=1 Tax=Luteimonas kalidii TaxID=3042025 RepID=A0ABT6JS43_9GAMM|nr:LysR family transcriptional regulator [Luteimonas kalidii]MDH5832806.1 LysR family transcriptional regulator [Luteimonas kalidii]
MDPALLPSLAWFAHVARHGSFTRAAEEMGVSRAALSQSLKSLERQLGVRLLYRTTRHMSLTEAGQALFDTLRPSLAGIEQAVQALGEAQDVPSGLVRVNTSRLAARALIEPHLAEFRDRHPKVALELVMSDSLSNIIAEGCDAGIRLGQSLAEHMVAVPISPALSMAVVGAPAYLARHGVPKAPADLAAHDCINYRFAGTGALHDWEFTAPGRKGGHFTQAVTGRLVTNDDQCMVRAAAQGLGLMQIVDVAVQAELADGRLVRVLRDWTHPLSAFYLYAPSREQMPRKVRALIDFLVERREAISLV